MNSAPTKVAPDESFRDSIATIDAAGKRVWLFPKQPQGRLYRARQWVSYALLALLFAGPWLRIQGLPVLLLNVVERKFIIFGQIFWPQDFFILLLGFLAFVLFVILFTVVYGRVFCGWVCPQTIFLEMVFRRIEYWLEGDAPRQKALAKAAWTWNKIWRKTSKHALFGLISLLIANTFLAYLIGTEALLGIVMAPPLAHLGGLGAMVVFTGLFYAVFAHFREQVCTIACPYGRLQGVMLDQHSISVAYDHGRGEPREKLRKNQARTAGDCIDCRQCVQVCPTGIDIRNGAQQMECINCTACIDACNAIMDLVGKPPGLIRYDAEVHIEQGSKFRVTGRLKAYTAVLLLLAAAMVGLLVTRSNVAATVLRTPGQLFQKTDRGTVTNLYNISVINKTNAAMPLELRVLQPAGGAVQLVGQPVLQLPAQGLVEGVFFAELPADALPRTSNRLRIGVYSAGRLITEAETKFLAPPR
ncbi:cytochrome c oxidase accessory protein CcoG [Hymenobacter gummosus]|uniref:Cytochrome c oxidase accessory protein CcoG n=1 Tax=Hymenobacter gummosus TaxID=1776032 RepID=A0A3S0HC77_9BACT|nr:cytochrome c oxidase accessory protein CcoG [Hymenobacter gummosus]RTQ53300.1 cytochrome c oxidase accessory protein CcoG [Hymenobacter gummosus]